MSAPKSLLWLSAAIVAYVSAPANAADIQVPLDHVQAITLEKPAKTIYIGNPAIADITVVDSRHVFVLGKTFGSTNLIALDAVGQETANEQVIVTGRSGTEVTVQRGVFRTTMTCTASHCEAAPAPGDDATKEQRFVDPPYDALTGQADKRESAGKTSAGAK